MISTKKFKIISLILITLVFFRSSCNDTVKTSSTVSSSSQSKSKGIDKAGNPTHEYNNLPSKATSTYENIPTGQFTAIKLKQNDSIPASIKKLPNTYLYFLYNNTGHKIHVSMKSNNFKDLQYADHEINPNEKLLLIHPIEKNVRLTITHTGIKSGTTPNTTDPILAKFMWDVFPRQEGGIYFSYSADGVFTYNIK